MITVIAGYYVLVAALETVRHFREFRSLSLHTVLILLGAALCGIFWPVVTLLANLADLFFSRGQMARALSKGGVK